MPLPEPVPPRRDVGAGGRAVLAVQQGEAGGGERLLVMAGRDEQVEAQLGAGVELGLGDRAGDDGVVRNRRRRGRGVGRALWSRECLAWALGLWR